MHRPHKAKTLYAANKLHHSAYSCTPSGNRKKPFYWLFACSLSVLHYFLLAKNQGLRLWHSPSLNLRRYSYVFNYGLLRTFRRF